MPPEQWSWLAERQGDIGAAMLPLPAGVWRMPPEVLATLRELRLRLGAQLPRLLQRPARGTVCRAVRDRRPRQAPPPRLGHRPLPNPPPLAGEGRVGAEDGARPIISHNRAATFMQPQVKALTIWSTANTMAGAWRKSGSTT